MSQPTPLTVSQSDDSQQHAGPQGANVRIEITEGVAKWLSIVLALMFFASIIGTYLAMLEASEARADAASARAQTQVATDAAHEAKAQADRVDAKAVYMLQRAEGFLEQLSAEGYKVPPDLLHHEGKKP